MTYKRNSNILDSELDGNQVMMNFDKGKYYGLNPIAKAIWDFLEEPRSFEAIVNELQEQFDVSQEQCAKETEEFLEEAIKHEIIQRA